MEYVYGSMAGPYAPAQAQGSFGYTTSAPAYTYTVPYTFSSGATYSPLPFAAAGLAPYYTAGLPDFSAAEFPPSFAPHSPPTLIPGLAAPLPSVSPGKLSPPRRDSPKATGSVHDPLAPEGPVLDKPRVPWPCLPLPAADAADSLPVDDGIRAMSPESFGPRSPNEPPVIGLLQAQCPTPPATTMATVVASEPLADPPPALTATEDTAAPQCGPQPSPAPLFAEVVEAAAAPSPEAVPDGADPPRQLLGSTSPAASPKAKGKRASKGSASPGTRATLRSTSPPGKPLAGPSSPNLRSRTMAGGSPKPGDQSPSLRKHKSASTTSASASPKPTSKGAMRSRTPSTVDNLVGSPPRSTSKPGPATPLSQAEEATTLVAQIMADASDSERDVAGEPPKAPAGRTPSPRPRPTPPKAAKSPAGCRMTPPRQPVSPAFARCSPSRIPIAPAPDSPAFEVQLKASPLRDAAPSNIPQSPAAPFPQMMLGSPEKSPGKGTPSRKSTAIKGNKSPSAHANGTSTPPKRIPKQATPSKGTGSSKKGARASSPNGGVA